MVAKADLKSAGITSRAGSSPAAPTNFNGPVTQLDRVTSFYLVCRRFDSYRDRQFDGRRMRPTIVQDRYGS